MAALSSLTDVSPPASFALPCKNPDPSPNPIPDRMEHEALFRRLSPVRESGRSMAEEDAGGCRKLCLNSS